MLGGEGSKQINNPTRFNIKESIVRGKNSSTCQEKPWGDLISYNVSYIFLLGIVGCFNICLQEALFVSSAIFK